ncbi:hypothetical protein CEY04_21455 [Achromobacter sp. HZ28]|nr:hypothetical protein CEY05_22630 [Achromobacter sp. HZ34]OWT73928.1 hypothetical protein CEY04_21455 [Achromobacter sp. HZ28]
MEAEGAAFAEPRGAISDACCAENEFQKIPAIPEGAGDAPLGSADSILTGRIHGDRHRVSEVAYLEAGVVRSNGPIQIGSKGSS